MMFYCREYNLQDRVLVLTDDQDLHNMYFINIYDGIYDGIPWWYLYVRIKNQNLSDLMIEITEELVGNKIYI